MQSDIEQVTRRVLTHPKYQELVRRRNRVSLAFFALMLVIYAGFILTLAYAPGVLARPIGEGYTLTVGLLSAILVCISAVVMIAVYVRFSNRHFDPLIADIVRDAK